MECLFCKKDSSTSRSVEHIIPESLGNTTAILPRGVVCDQCNNYFARKIEQPFLSSPSILGLRFHEAIPNKKGRIPEVEGELSGGTSVLLRRYPRGPFVGSITIDHPRALQEPILRGRFAAIFGSQIGPESTIVSRFLAKAGLEAAALRLLQSTGGVDWLVHDEQFDPIRDHTRQGQGPPWAFQSRRIYTADKAWFQIGHDDFRQVIHEHDLLYTQDGELYFVLALFGMELVMNLGCSDLTGYREWLWRHGHGSPLHVGKNLQANLRPAFPKPRNVSPTKLRPSRDGGGSLGRVAIILRD